MNIPDEAVEEVATRLFDTHEHVVSWEQAGDAYRQEAREALEAAAPFIAAQAWDEGAQAQAAAYGMDKDTGANPYSKASITEHHWLLNEDDLRWGCQGCDWTGDKIEDFWTAHKTRRTNDNIPF